MMNTRQLNFVWVVLMLATLATFAIGEIGERIGIAGPLAMAALLAISIIKGRLVMLDFMGLRGVKFFWRGLMIGWLLLVSALIAIAYWIALK
ncbi:cytochrome C oxidase subunit IV family protein [Zoogloea sp.]|uniref:cytochrome C oxidase subunit IV family protein n=1 Tax=Zoogloea sp. TaxID=49181 RepID=UPI002639E620|nr:cytochrome C oxidase subunit IV family protein [Zoogloea sp.]